MSVWFKNNKLVFDDTGKLVFCDTCPCGLPPIPCCVDETIPQVWRTTIPAVTAGNGACCNGTGCAAFSGTYDCSYVGLYESSVGEWPTGEGSSSFPWFIHYWESAEFPCPVGCDENPDPMIAFFSLAYSGTSTTCVARFGIGYSDEWKDFPGNTGQLSSGDGCCHGACACTCPDFYYFKQMLSAASGDCSSDIQMSNRVSFATCNWPSSFAIFCEPIF